jgi:hypothetical protein
LFGLDPEGFKPDAEPLLPGLISAEWVSRVFVLSVTQAHAVAIYGALCELTGDSLSFQ